MNDYRNPTVESIPGATGLDRSIKSIQAKLAALPWLEKAFGRAIQQRGKLTVKSGERRTEREYIFPEVYNEREPISLMMNDNLRAYCFFHPTGPMDFLSYEPFSNFQLVEQPVAVIFWLNMKKIDPAKNYDFSEALRAAAYKILQQCPGLRLVRSLTQVEEVFAPFTITETFKPLIKPPFAAFRFDATLTFDYLEACVD
jgi:hypothetical protein